MAVERHPVGASLIDVLDRVLDKGIVIDAWVRLSPVGIDLTTAGSRVVVASSDTYLEYAEAAGSTPSAARPTVAISRSDAVRPTGERLTSEARREVETAHD